MNSIQKQYTQTRKHSQTICKPLAIEDYVVQPIPEVSPPKWHLAHTTWFFEQFILVKHLKDYTIFHPDFAFLFNSYYNHMGERSRRDLRGFMTRPTVEEIMAYRKHVDLAIAKLLSQNSSKELIDLVEIGIHHEQQHQELLAYDIKYILGTQPTFPSVGLDLGLKEINEPPKWLCIEEGVYEIGHSGSSFSYDNERPRHKQYLHTFEISNQLVTNGEFLSFIADGGYQNFDHWHDEGWHYIKNQEIEAPLYWHKIGGHWMQYTLEGLKELSPKQPLSHISLYEAFAFAEWKGARLPTEFEWEVGADLFEWGQLWEWTHSAYLPYPGFQKASGALGEYNGKFMVNQHVLKGASIATPAGHARKTYRNFFHPSSRWIFSGLRLAKKQDQ